VGTNVINGLSEPKPIKPVVEPVNGQVWSALAEIGRQLQILAHAHMGQGNFAPWSGPAPAYAPDSPSVVELTNQFLLAKARAGKSDRYLGALRNSLSKFTAGRAHQMACDVSVADVEKWMARPEWKPRTQIGYLKDVRTLYNFAIRRGLVKTNPANGVELPVEEPDEIEIHSPADVAAVLNFARSYNLNQCRALACRYFAGLRSCEADRLDEKFVGDKYIEITAATAKGGRARRRRLVTIQPNLRAWLNLGGELPVRNSGQRWQFFNKALLAATGIVFPHNCARHSFVSYHLAKFQNAGQTANEAGNSETVMFRNYRQLVTPEAAEAYFGILPEK
jgi:site-specific recombinase XerC